MEKYFHWKTNRKLRDESDENKSSKSWSNKNFLNFSKE